MKLKTVRINCKLVLPFDILIEDGQEFNILEVKQLDFNGTVKIKLFGRTLVLSDDSTVTVKRSFRNAQH